MPLLLSEGDVRALLTMDDLIDGMEAALTQFSAGQAQQPLRTVMRSRVAARAGRHHAGIRQRPADARRQAGNGLPNQRGAGTANASGDHRAPRAVDWSTPGDSGRPLHHRGANGGGVGGVGAAPGAPGCARARCHRLGRPGAEPHRSHSTRQGSRRDSRVESDARSRRKTDRRHAAAHDRTVAGGSTRSPTPRAMPTSSRS